MEDFEIYEVENKSKSDEKSTIKSDFFDWLEILVSAIILLVVLFTFFFKIVIVDGPSMENTLHNGERIIISNIGGEAMYGDIVVVSRNQNNVVGNSDASAPIIKRVIATAGQTVDIDFEKGIVYVDGVALEEPYVKTPTNLYFDNTEMYGDTYNFKSSLILKYIFLILFLVIITSNSIPIYLF